jgi:hypothetical protein
MDDLAPPEGFEQHASGLVIPKDAIPIQLEREQWTEQEAKILARADKVLRRRKLVTILGCRDARCLEEPEVRYEARPGGYALVCHHLERIVIRGR